MDSRIQGNRSKKLISLALNKALREKLTAVRESKKKVKIDDNNSDPDYSTLNRPIKSNTKITVLSNILVNLPITLIANTESELKSVSITDTACEIEDYIHCILSEIVVNVVEVAEDNRKATRIETVKEHESPRGGKKKRKLVNWVKNNSMKIPRTDIITAETGNIDYIHNILNELVVNAIEVVESKMYTKKGEVRKRKKIESTPIARKKQRVETYIKKHNVKEPCSCKLKCSDKLSHARQQDINSQFWKLSKEQQKLFVFNCNTKYLKIRNTTKKIEDIVSRMYSYKYYLPTENNEKVNVCKLFLLATLGFDKDNDRILKNVRCTASDSIAPKTDQRTRSSSRKVDRAVIIEHINSFHPTNLHYRREHAPHRKYLPSDISISSMFEDFKMKHPNQTFSYELYRKVVSDLNISFTKLGHEECWECETYQLHKKAENHDNTSNCDICAKWSVHKNKAVNARIEYQQDAEKNNITGELFASVDLQKVIMLHRMETFKEIIFTPRIIAFNESFVPLGKGNKDHQNYPFAMIWHEAVAGRSKHDIASTFYAFFICNRDIQNFTIWLDNCSSQNKNWTLISFFLYLVNCCEVAIENLTIKYFEPGHTFMAADSFHHQVELSLKRRKRVYDFNDFAEVVQRANSGKVNVINMQLNKFHNFTDCTSKYKMQKIQPRIYLKDIVLLNFKRGNKNFSYKTGFNNKLETYQDVFMAKFVKGNLPKPTARISFRGISEERKQNLISKLKFNIPQNRISFWENLPVGGVEREDSE